MSNKKAKTKYQPSSRKEAKYIPISEEINGKIAFSFLWFDSTHKWGNSKKVDFWSIAEKIKSFENLEWKHLGANEAKHHQVSFDRIHKDARRYLMDHKFDDQDEIWSLRLNGKNRLWGFQNGRNFMVIWWDPDHCVCPSNK